MEGQLRGTSVAEGIFEGHQVVSQHGYEVLENMTDCMLWDGENWVEDPENPNALKYVGERGHWLAKWDYMGPYLCPKLKPDSLKHLSAESSNSVVFERQEPQRRSYDPMTIRSLHTKFAKLEKSNEAIESFANKYGFLGWTKHLVADVHERPGPEAKGDRMGESILLWHHHIDKVRKLVHLHRLLAEYAPDSEVYEWLVHDHLNNDPYHLSPYGINQPAPKRVENPKQVARQRLRGEVDRELRSECYPRMSSAGNAFVVVPRSLLGAIYAQLAMSLMGMQRPPRQCGFCSAWFTPGDEREKYCSSSCRYKSYRRSKKGVGPGLAVEIKRA